MKTVRANRPAPFRAHQSERGFTLAELVVIIAIIGILSVMAVPAFLRYYQAATLKSGAQQFAALINQARELAIKENGRFCVMMSSPTQMMYRKVDCSGTVWVGPGTDAAGNINLPPRITAAPLTVTANPIFDYVGSAATQSGGFTLTNTQTSATLKVTVAASGRVTIQP
jgi:prepilin-type N-terminal cleavage/methylation domain-containing protein